MAAEPKPVKKLDRIDASAYALCGTDGQEIALDVLVKHARREKEIEESRAEIETNTRRGRELSVRYVRSFLKKQPVLFLLTYGTACVWTGGLVSVLWPLMILLVGEGAFTMVAGAHVWTKDAEWKELERLIQRRSLLESLANQEPCDVFAQIPEEIRTEVKELAAAVERYNDQVAIFNNTVARSGSRTGIPHDPVAGRLARLRARLHKEGANLRSALACAELTAANLAIAGIRGASDLGDGPAQLRERVDAVNVGLDERLLIADEVRSDQLLAPPSSAARKARKKKS